MLGRCILRTGSLSVHSSSSSSAFKTMHICIMRKVNPLVYTCIEVLTLEVGIVIGNSKRCHWHRCRSISFCCSMRRRTLYLGQWLSRQTGSWKPRRLPVARKGSYIGACIGLAKTPKILCIGLWHRSRTMMKLLRVEDPALYISLLYKVCISCNCRL
jgi:hypothetical protein